MEKDSPESGRLQHKEVRGGHDVSGGEGRGRDHLLPQPIDDVLRFPKVNLVQRAPDFILHVLEGRGGRERKKTNTQGIHNINK